MSGSEVRAFFVNRIGNQAIVRIDGQVVARFGEPGDPSHDAAKAPS